MPLRSHLVRSAWILSTALGFAPFAAAQCTNTWLPGYGCPGANAYVNASTPWDPDGAGPQPAVVVVGGGFTLVDTMPAEGLATWQPVTGAWVPFPVPNPPLPGPGLLIATAMTTLPNGDLVVAYGGSLGSTSRVARWNGSTWNPLGADFPSQVDQLLVRPNGELLASGEFPGGVFVFVGATWQVLGGGVDGPVRGMANGSAGELFVGGAFDNAGTTPATGVARWNGTNWSAVGGFTQYPWSIAAGPAGVFAGTSSGLQHWDGSAWSLVPGLAVAMYPHPTIFSVTALPSGRVVAGGYISSAGGVPTQGLAVWNPASGAWSVLGWGVSIAGSTQIATVTELANGGLLVGGRFSEAGGAPALHVAHWDGTQWVALGSGFSTAPNCVEVTAAGDVLVAGDSIFLPGGVLRHGGSAWAPLGGGITGVNGGTVEDLLRLPNGDVLAGGQFDQAGGGPARSLARWDGVAWSEFGGVTWFGSPGRVTEMLQRANGDLVVVGTFDSVGGVPCSNIAVWNGSAWSSVGVVTGQILAVAESLTGELFVANWSGSAVWRVLRWDDPVWTEIYVGAANERITDIAVHDDGGLVVVGDVVLSGQNRKAYVAVVTPSGVVRHVSTDFRSSANSLHRLPGGDLLVAGTFRSLGAIVCDGLARLTGGSAGTLVPMLDGSGAVDVATFANGDLLLGGVAYVPGASVWLVGRLSTTCPALATATGGCGHGALTSRTLPWIGDPLASEATGLPALGVSIGVRGFGTTSIPLASLLPLGVAGCDLAVTDDILELHVPTAGVVRTSIDLPNDAALVGLVLHEQVVTFAASAPGIYTSLTSTNRLTHTIGAF